MNNQIFVNLPVRDLEKTREFFGSLGYGFNEKYCDHNALCMVVSDDIYVMLLLDKFFATFTNKPVADAKRTSEVLVALSAESRAAVDETIVKAAAAGGSEPRPAQDYGWMYSRAFEDLDGHIWEVIYMAPESGSGG